MRGRETRSGSGRVEREQANQNHQGGDHAAEHHDAAQVNLGQFVSGLECNALVHGRPFNMCSDIEVTV